MADLVASNVAYFIGFVICPYVFGECSYQYDKGMSNDVEMGRPSLS